MKYCKNCNLKINGIQNKCLFCGSKLEEINQQILSTFPTKKPHAFYIDRIKKIVLFSLLILIAVSILLECYLFKERLYWFLVSFSAVYIYLVVSVALNFSKGIVAKISNISILTSLEAIGVFAFFELGVNNLCLTYVFPGICIINIISTLIVYLITKGKNVHDQLIYIFINILYGFIPIIFIITNLVKITFICSICIAIALLSLLSLFFFVDKESKDEFKRRFHI